MRQRKVDASGLDLWEDRGKLTETHSKALMGVSYLLTKLGCSHDQGLTERVTAKGQREEGRKRCTRVRSLPLTPALPFQPSHVCGPFLLGQPCRSCQQFLPPSCRPAAENEAVAFTRLN